MTVGFFSPLPPARTGVAEYSAALFQALQKIGTIRANADGEVNLYHIGNNRLHTGIYDRALRRAGVIVLHDAMLHHFLLGTLNETAYIDEFVYNYGEWSRGLAQDLWRRRRDSAASDEYFRYPMLRRICETALAVVVHNPAAASLARRHAPNARIIEIPHLFQMPALPSSDSVTAWRARAGVPAEATLFGVFGHLRESKRLPSVLRAFSRLRDLQPESRLLIAGDFVSPDLRHALEPIDRKPGVVRIPYLPETEFWLAASAVDCCISPRYPSAAETSGIAIRLMGIGKPVIVTDAEENSGFPPDACLRIPCGPAEVEGLWENMLLLTQFPDIARQIGQRGAHHIAILHDATRVADLYWKTLCEYRP